MHDLDHLQKQRGATVAKASADVDSSPRSSELSPTLQATDALLARLRDGDELADAERWLAVIRGDRRPATPAELDAAIAGVAAQDRVDAETVRAGIERLLAADGGIAAWQHRLQRRPAKFGRITLALPEAASVTAHDARRQIHQLPLVPLKAVT